MTRLAVFDCDGTLADSQANICRAMATAFMDAGLPPPPTAQIRHVVGLSLVEAIAVLLPDGADADHRRLAIGYQDAFRAMRSDGTLDDEPLFDGIVAVLDRLAADDWLLGVATGKSHRGLQHLLAHHGIAERFATLQTADRHPSKPDPAMLRAAMTAVGAEPATTAMIGDTGFDMAMARAAGVRAVGVAWGYHGHADLVAGGADAVAEQVAELPALLTRR